MSVQNTVTPVIDVRTVVPRERHALIFSTFATLAKSEAMELVNDHDPRPLRAEFEAREPGNVSWEYLESGPSTWRVRITRLGRGHGAGQCCGGCGGA